MNNDTDQLGHDLGLSFQDRIDILFHEIELAVRWDRPSILFAIYKSGQIRDEVNTQLQERLKDLDQKIHNIRTKDKEHFDFLSEIPSQPDLLHIVLFIDGFTWECGLQGVGVFNEFNKHREYFIDNNIRAIFWLFENEVPGFAANATECWNLRHRVVEFTDAPAQDKNSIQSTEPVCQCGDNFPVEPGMSEDLPEKGIAAQDDQKGTTAHANALLRLGILFWRKGNFSRSLKYLQESADLSVQIASNSIQAQCQNALALVNAEMGDIDAAVSAYQAAISLSPESGFLWNNLGQLLAKNERNEEAIRAYQQALSCSPQDFLSWDRVGQVYIKLGEYKFAISAFEKAIEIAPYYEYSWAGLGKAYMKSGYLDKGEVPLRKAVEINVNLIDAWTDLGSCYVQQKRGIDALAAFTKAVELNPQNAELWDELGKLHLQTQAYAESISAFQKVISLSPQSREAYIRLAFALFQIGDYEASASFYEKGISQFDDKETLAALWIRLGDTYLQMKDYGKAIAAYEQSDQLKAECERSNNDAAKEPEIRGLEIELNQGPDIPEPEIMQEQEPDIQISGLMQDKPLEILTLETMQDHEPQQDLPEPERGENMNEANQLFDLKTAAEWNEHGNSHLKAGAYNDAIVAYTKAIELAPNMCWPYIQNLAQVHYQKGKAKGKLAVGKTEDPDVWGADEEMDSASFSSFDAIPFSSQGEVIEEPCLEKSSGINPENQTQTRSDIGNIEAKPSDPVHEESNPNQETVFANKEESSAGIVEIEGSKVDGKQNCEIEAVVDNKISPQIVENTPQNSIDWNELGNTYTSSKQFEAAIEAYKKAIEMNPKYGQPYTNLGFIYYRLGKYEVSVLLYKKSIELLDIQEDKALSWNRLGDAYRRLGDYGNALAAYQNASELAPAASPVMARARATLLENIVAG